MKPCCCLTEGHTEVIAYRVRRDGQPEVMAHAPIRKAGSYASVVKRCTYAIEVGEMGVAEVQKLVNQRARELGRTEVA